MILFEGVTKKYPGNITAVADINLKIESGEFVFLTGVSGVGKTTLLRLLIRDILPTSGSVFIDNWEVNKLPSRQLPYLRRHVSIIFQDFKLLSDRTVAENIAVAYEILGKKPKEIEEKIYYTLKIINLENKGNYFPKQLSLGEQQRVAIGRAIVGEAKILLADEPTGNLDPKTSWEILKIINNINKLGTTVIMATHNVQIVNKYKKRVVSMKKGKITSDEKEGRYEAGQKDS